MYCDNMMRLKLKKKKKNGSKIIIILILIIISVIILIEIFAKKTNSILISYGESEVRKIITILINSAVDEEVSTTMENDNFFDVENKGNGEINIINYDSVKINTVLNNITNSIQTNLEGIERGNITQISLLNNLYVNEDNLENGIIYEVPLGSIFNNAYLNNLGPKIPVKLEVIGDVESGVRSNIKEYGINNALLEIGINISITCRIIMPFITKQITIDNTIPVVIKLIQGKIPEYYFNSFSTPYS